MQQAKDFEGELDKEEVEVEVLNQSLEGQRSPSRKRGSGWEILSNRWYKNGYKVEGSLPKCGGIEQSIAKRRIRKLLRQEQTDIMYLQETHLRNGEGQFLKEEFFGLNFHALAPVRTMEWGGILAFVKKMGISGSY